MADKDNTGLYIAGALLLVGVGGAAAYVISQDNAAQVTQALAAQSAAVEARQREQAMRDELQRMRDTQTRPATPAAQQPAAPASENPLEGLIKLGAKFLGGFLGGG